MERGRWLREGEVGRGREGGGRRRGGGEGKGGGRGRGEAVETGICSSPFLLLLLYAQIVGKSQLTLILRWTLHTSDLPSIVDVSGGEGQTDVFS